MLESEWLPDEGDVAWEHLALLGRKELAAFSDNIAVFLNSRSPLLETLHKQINAMVRLLSWPSEILENGCKCVLFATQGTPCVRNWQLTMTQALPRRCPGTRQPIWSPVRHIKVSMNNNKIPM